MPPVQRTNSLEEVLIARDASPKGRDLSTAATPQLGVGGAHFSNPLYGRCASDAYRLGMLAPALPHMGRLRPLCAMRMSVSTCAVSCLLTGANNGRVGAGHRRVVRDCLRRLRMTRNPADRAPQQRGAAGRSARCRPSAAASRSSQCACHVMHLSCAYQLGAQSLGLPPGFWIVIELQCPFFANVSCDTRRFLMAVAAAYVGYQTMPACYMT